MFKQNPLKKISTAIEGTFGFKRKFDYHTGIDLYCDDGDSVFAIEDGIVMANEPFTGVNCNSPWWNDTDYVGVLGKSCYIVYGEIKSELKIGSNVSAGDIIGNVKTVLKKDKGKPMTMLHLELYGHYVKEPIVWLHNIEKPLMLLDPTFLIDFNS